MRPSRVHLLTWFLVAASLVFCYRSTFVLLLTQWLGNEAFSHGLLIPWVSLYIAWVRRDRLRSLGTWRPHPVGVLVLILAIGPLLSGRMMGVAALEELSIPLTLSALVIMVIGPAGLRVLWLPIAYLLFMIPSWEFVTEPLHYPLQLLAASIGGLLLRGLGIPVLRQDNLLYLPNITIEVAKLCSGVNYLVAIVAVGIPLAYLSLRGTVRRVLLVIGGTLIAILANPVRVALIGFLAYRGLSGNIHGPGHVLQGVFVASAAYLGLIAGAWILSRGQRAERTGHAEQRPRADCRVGQATAQFSNSRVTLLLALGSCAAFVFAGSVQPAQWLLPSGDEPGLQAIPLELGGWKGHEAFPPIGPADLQPGTERQVWRTYQRDSGDVVHLWLGAFAARGPSGLVTYWGDTFAPRAVPAQLLLSAERAIGVNRVSFPEGNRETALFYWYDLNGRHTPDRIRAKVYALWCRLTRRPGPVAIAVIDRPSPRGGQNTPSVSLARFGREALPALLRALEDPAPRSSDRPRPSLDQ